MKDEKKERKDEKPIKEEELLQRTDAFLGIVGRWGKTALDAVKAFGNSAIIPFWNWLRRVFAKDTAPNLVLVTTLIVTIAAAGLSALHTVTEERIEAAQTSAFEDFMVLDAGRYMVPSALGENIYETFYSYDGVRQGFIVRVTLRGMGGPVHIAVGVSNLLEVLDAEVYSHRETGDLSPYIERAKAEALAFFEGEVR